MSDILSVTARISEIQSTLASLRTAPPAAPSAGAGATTFAARLAAASAGTVVGAGAGAGAGLATGARAGGAAATTAAAAPAAGAVAGTARPSSLRPSAGATTPYDSLFTTATARYGLPPGLLRAVAKAESGFDPTARSHAGAIGLMQLMPGTARELGVDPRNPSQAVDGAARLLRDHLKTFGSVPLALAAYNAGPGAVRKYDGIPPYGETQAYVRRVIATMKGSS